MSLKLTATTFSNLNDKKIQWKVKNKIKGLVILKINSQMYEKIVWQSFKWDWETLSPKAFDI